MSAIDRLYSRACENSPVCVGLDTSYSYLPNYLKEDNRDLSEKIFLFNKTVIDATSDIAACYKLQSAYYEAMGIKGLMAYSKTLSYLRSREIPCIADVKRSDISATAEMYAKAHFEGDFEADIATLSPYMGSDTIAPFYPYLEQGKSVFVLVKTTNPSASDFEDLECEGEPLYMHVAKAVCQWGEGFIGESGFSSVGAVVGINRPQEARSIKKALPSAFFLMPGYGAQQGELDMLTEFFSEGICGVINSSRGIICAHMAEGIDKGFEQSIRNAAITMKRDIDKCTR
ncbi:MAG: orotidine-5'-phosphate decarboxylase [Eubacteriaceae bacterium]|nr:orotidine-5'-phosphate decarboxylase [Eubacteriaceae bacterium]